MAVTVTFKLTGIHKTFGLLGRISKRAKKGLDEGIYEAAVFLKKESNKVAPIDEGHLIAESFITFIPGKGAQSTALVGYGPPGSVSEAYAARQHWDKDYKHKKVVGRRWLYLEQPFRTHKRKMLSIVKNRVKQTIKFG